MHEGTRAMSVPRRVAYFSMEIALRPEIPTYSGGLGVLAADTIRAAADLRVPMLAVTLVHHCGYFRQHVLGDGWQTEEPDRWTVSQFAQEQAPRVLVTIENRSVSVRAWRYDIVGVTGFALPVYLLDTDLPENEVQDRSLTDVLYGGDERHRLCQEVVLGIGGVRMLRALGHDGIERYHMNEGHSGLLALELLDEEAKRAGRSIEHADVEAVRRKCVFTTHTAVSAGHDQFSLDLVRQVLGRREVYEMKEVFCCEGRLNMTYLALNLSHYVNGVAKRHGEITQRMFSSYKIDSITNGVHVATWTCGAFAELYDRHLPGWRADPAVLRHVLGIPREEVSKAHVLAKRDLISLLNDRLGVRFEEGAFTLGFARRATAYKRADLLLSDPERLRSMARSLGSIQVAYAGKAHPRDTQGKEIIKQIFAAADALRDEVRIVYIPNYDLAIAARLVAGVDLWLNTPEPPLEASGTSGMKAAVNGVPSLSILDGWWIEGHVEGLTGWSLGDAPSVARDDGSRAKDAESLYRKLSEVILPMFHRERERYVDVMAHAIAINGSYFNTHRMMQQYVIKAYFEEEDWRSADSARV